VPVSVAEPLPAIEPLPVELPLCDPIRSRSLALPVEDPDPVVVELPVPDDWARAYVEITTAPDANNAPTTKLLKSLLPIVFLLE